MEDVKMMIDRLHELELGAKVDGRQLPRETIFALDNYIRELIFGDELRGLNPAEKNYLQQYYATTIPKNSIIDRNVA